MPHFKTDIHKLKSNITFDKLQGMEFDELKVFIDNMRTEILSMWDSENKPPVIGKKESDIIKSFSQLKNYPVENLFYKDKNYPQFEGLIKNFTKLASPVNQFFPDMLKTRINGRSMYDWFSNKNLSTEFRRILVRTLRFD